MRIGITAKEVKANLRDAILAKRISVSDLETWLQQVEGWGKQHLYLGIVPKRSLAQTHLLNTSALFRFLKKNGVLAPATGQEPSASHVFQGADVDDELARLSWQSYAIDLERHEELDEVRELDDGEYEFHAYRRVPRRSASRCIIRKTDGVVLFLINVPLGDDHDSVRTMIEETARLLLAPLSIDSIRLAPILSALDDGALASFGPKQTRPLTVGVSPTQARYRADGARLEFKSTHESTGYTDCVPARHVRKAMQIDKFEGEAGKFRLSFVGPSNKPHQMIISLNGIDNRAFLFSRMSESEMLALVDQLIALAPGIAAGKK